MEKEKGRISVVFWEKYSGQEQVGDKPGVRRNWSGTHAHPLQNTLKRETIKENFLINPKKSGEIRPDTGGSKSLVLRGQYSEL